MHVELANHLLIKVLLAFSDCTEIKHTKVKIIMMQRWQTFKITGKVDFIKSILTELRIINFCGAASIKCDSRDRPQAGCWKEEVQVFIACTKLTEGEKNQILRLPHCPR